MRSWISSGVTTLSDWVMEDSNMEERRDMSESAICEEHFEHVVGWNVNGDWKTDLGPVTARASLLRRFHASMRRVSS